MIYKNYFKTHYRYSLSEIDILNYKNWFYAQWHFINSLIKIKKKSEVLEIGSGIGGFYSFIKEDKGKYMGIELDGEAVKFSNNYFNTNEFVQIPIEKLRNKNKFDYIFAFETLEHLESPLESIQKIAEVLKKGGIFCGTSPYPYYKNIIADETHLFVLHPKNWKRLFLLSGFKQVDLYPMSFFPFIWRINKHFNFRIPFYLPLRGFISTTLIVAKK